MERYIKQQGSKLKKLTIKKEDTKDENNVSFSCQQKKTLLCPALFLKHYPMILLFYKHFTFWDAYTRLNLM